MNFSIVVPVYNTEKYLKACIESIVAQNFKEYELILIDDGSTDNSGHICDEYSEKYENVVTIHQENQGVTFARKTGVANSKNDYIIFIDADDCIKEDYLSTISTLIIDNNEPDIVCLQFDYDSGKKYTNKLKEGIYSSNKLLKNLLIDVSDFPKDGNMPFSLWTKICKRQIVASALDNVPQSIIIGEDLLTLFYILNNDNQRLLISNYSGYVYRSNGLSVTHTFKQSYIEQYCLLCRELFSNFDDKNMVRCYALNMLLNLCTLMAESVKTFKEFKIQLQNNEYLREIDALAKEAKYTCKHFKTNVKVFLYNHKKYRLLYFLSK